MPVTSSQKVKRKFIKSKIKKGLDFNISRYTQESLEKLLKYKERLFEEQSLEVKENTNFYNSDLEEENFFLNNFSISKMITYSKVKNSIEVTNFLTNLIQQNTKK